MITSIKNEMKIIIRCCFNVIIAYGICIYIKNWLKLRVYILYGKKIE